MLCRCSRYFNFSIKVLKSFKITVTYMYIRDYSLWKWAGLGRGFSDRIDRLFKPNELSLSSQNPRKEPGIATHICKPVFARGSRDWRVAESQYLQS